MKYRQHLRGPVGEVVQLRVARPPEYTEFPSPSLREEIGLPSVTWHIEPAEPRLGIIQINVIAATTVDEILTATDDLEGRGASAFVIDLRNNSGGLLDTGIDIARIYLNSGVIIEQQYRGKPIETYECRCSRRTSRFTTCDFYQSKHSQRG